jgi:hypothetical protein
MKKRKLDKLEARQARVLEQVDRVEGRIRERQLEALDEYRRRVRELRDLFAERVEQNPGDYLSRRELADVERRLALLDAEERELRERPQPG